MNFFYTRLSRLSISGRGCSFQTFWPHWLDSPELTHTRMLNSRLHNFVKIIIFFFSFNTNTIIYCHNFKLLFYSLKELILDRNGIKELPAEIGLLKELKSISAAGNNIEILPIFLNMRALNLVTIKKFY